MTLVPGCEVSCRKPAPGPGRAADRGVGPRARLLRGARGRPTPGRAGQAPRRTGPSATPELAARLDRARGRPSTYEDVVAEAGGEAGLGRPHFARALVKRGGGGRHRRRLRPLPGRRAPRLRPQGPARHRPTWPGLATGSGGVAVLAHPLSLGLDPSAPGTAGGGAGRGRTRRDRGDLRLATRPDQRRALRRMARRQGLVATGGSDYHGSFKPDLEVGTGTGDLDVPDSALEELAARCH